MRTSTEGTKFRRGKRSCECSRSEVWWASVRTAGAIVNGLTIGACLRCEMVDRGGSFCSPLKSLNVAVPDPTAGKLMTQTLALAPVIYKHASPTSAICRIVLIVVGGWIFVTMYDNAIHGKESSARVLTFGNGRQSHSLYLRSGMR